MAPSPTRRSGRPTGERASQILIDGQPRGRGRAGQLDRAALPSSAMGSHLPLSQIQPARTHSHQGTSGLPPHYTTRGRTDSASARERAERDEYRCIFWRFPLRIHIVHRRGEGGGLGANGEERRQQKEQHKRARDRHEAKGACRTPLSSPASRHTSHVNNKLWGRPGSWPPVLIYPTWHTNNTTPPPLPPPQCRQQGRDEGRASASGGALGSVPGSSGSGAGLSWDSALKIA